MLGEEDLQRYNRQIIHRDFGEVGQRNLKESHAVIVGVGGLGCPAATYLAYAGVGRITLIDHETVELANLNRQTLHWEENIGEKKVISAAAKLGQMNPSIDVVPRDVEVTEQNARDLIRGVGVVLDGMNNFESRSTVNRACISEGIPYIHGGVWGLNGQITTIIPRETPCYACIYPRKPREIRPVPVLGVTPGLIGTLEAVEAIKLLTGLGRPLAGKMLLVNAATMDFGLRDLVRDPDCRGCGRGKEQKR